MNSQWANFIAGLNWLPLILDKSTRGNINNLVNNNRLNPVIVRTLTSIITPYWNDCLKYYEPINNSIIIRPNIIVLNKRFIKYIFFNLDK